jgi:fatty-acyl-CoA synthase
MVVPFTSCLKLRGVTVAFAVPTVWQMLLEHLRSTGGKLTTLKQVTIGGATCPEDLLRRFCDDYGVEARHGWGMTELSPIGTIGAPPAEIAGGQWRNRGPRVF